MAGFEVVSALIKKKTTASARKKLFAELLNKADANADGAVSYAEYVDVLDANNIEVDKDELLRLFLRAEKDAKGQVDLVKTRAKTAFETYDVNKDDLVSKAEMSYVSGARLNKAAIERVFAIHDEDLDGYLSRKELYEMMKKSSKQK